MVDTASLSSVNGTHSTYGNNIDQHTSARQASHFQPTQVSNTNVRPPIRIPLAPDNMNQSAWRTNVCHPPVPNFSARQLDALPSQHGRQDATFFFLLAKYLDSFLNASAINRSLTPEQKSQLSTVRELVNKYKNLCINNPEKFGDKTSKTKEDLEKKLSEILKRIDMPKLLDHIYEIEVMPNIISAVENGDADAVLREQSTDRENFLSNYNDAPDQETPEQKFNFRKSLIENQLLRQGDVDLNKANIESHVEDMRAVKTASTKLTCLMLAIERTLRAPTFWRQSSGSQIDPELDRNDSRRSSSSSVNEQMENPDSENDGASTATLLRRPSSTNISRQLSTFNNFLESDNLDDRSSSATQLYSRSGSFRAPTFWRQSGGSQMDSESDCNDSRKSSSSSVNDKKMENPDSKNDGSSTATLLRRPSSTNISRQSSTVDNFSRPNNLDDGSSSATRLHSRSGSFNEGLMTISPVTTLTELSVSHNVVATEYDSTVGEKGPVTIEDLDDSFVIAEAVSATEMITHPTTGKEIDGGAESSGSLSSASLTNERASELPKLTSSLKTNMDIVVGLTVTRFTGDKLVTSPAENSIISPIHLLLIMSRQIP